MSAERRSHPRLPLRALVEVRPHDADETMREFAVNVSTGGMFIRTEDPYPAGTMIYVQFRLAQGDEVIEALAHVVRVSPADTPSPGMGVEFVSLDDESRRLIEGVVSARVKRVENP